MEIGLNKLFLFPEKLRELVHASKDENAIDNTYPISVELSLTNRCNFDCVWCSDKKIRNDYKGDINKEVLFKHIDELAKGGTKGICVEGGGEPVLYQDFKEVVQKIKSTGMSVGLITNGSIFNYEEIIDCFEWIRVSLDVSTASQMEKLKGSKSFDQVISNIEKMCKLRKDTVIGVAYVLSNKNFVSLEKIVKKIKSFGADYFYIRPVIDHPELWPKNLNIDKLMKYSDDKFSVLLSAMKEHQIRGNNNLPCVANSLTTIVTADGNVHLCGRLNQFKDWGAMGNLYKNTFEEIWHGEIRKKQSITVKNDQFCSKKCPECRLTKFNIAVNDLSQTKTKNFI